MSVSKDVPVLRVFVVIQLVAFLLQATECLELLVLPFKHLAFLVRFFHLCDLRRIEEGLNNIESVFQLEHLHVDLVLKVVGKVLVLRVVQEECGKY